MGDAPKPSTSAAGESRDAALDKIQDAGKLIETHQAGVWRYLRALGCEASLADDLAQDAFLAMLGKPFEQRSEAATRSWLRRTAYNLMIDYRRREGRVVAVENIEAFDSAWLDLTRDDDTDQQLIDALRTCLETLTPRVREALQLRYRDQAPRSEIARQLEISEHGVRNLLQRARKKLGDCIGRQRKS